MKQNLKILGIKLNSVDRQLALGQIDELSKKKTASLVCTVNVEFIMSARADAAFKKVLNEKSAMNLMDGSGVVWAAKFLSGWVPAPKVLREIYIVISWLIFLILYPIMSAAAAKKFFKVSGADFVWDICRWAADKNKSIFILGNKNGLDPNSVQKASLELQTNVYGLKIAGTHSSTPDEADEKENLEIIKRSGADILLCSFGSPSQELWLAKNLGRSGAKIGVGLGGTFDFIAGVQKRAPRLISAIGFEWLYRLIRQPRRFKRQLALPRFAFAILRERLAKA